MIARPNVPLAMGILAPVLYVAAVIVGAAFTPGYSHASNAISELLLPGAAAKAVLDPVLALYNLLIIAFALGLRPAFRRLGAELSILPSLFLALVGIFGIAMWPFPQDPFGGPATTGGIVHLVLAGGQSFGTMLAVLSMAVSLRGYPGWRRFCVYCLVTLAAIFVSGAGAALAGANMWPAFGLVERLTIGLFLQWVLVTAGMLWVSGGKAQAFATI